MQFWAKITGRAYVVDPGIEHEPRRFFDAFCWEIKPAKFQDPWFCDFWDEFFSQIFFEFLVFCRYCWQDLVEFLPISKKEFKNSLIWFFFLAGRKCPGYLARARARAPGPRVALGPPAPLTIVDYDQRLFARAQLSKNELKILFNWSFRFFYYIKVDFWPAHPFLVSALALCKKKADTKKLIQKISHITGYISYLLFGGLRTGNFFYFPLCDFTQTPRFRSVRETRSFY